WREHAPIKIEDRQRHQDNNQCYPLGQLPSRSFQSPGRDHHERKYERRPDTYSAGNEYRDGRGGNGRVRSEAEVGVEVHAKSKSPLKFTLSGLSFIIPAASYSPTQLT